MQKILDHSQDINVGIYYEHYSGTLQHYFTEHGPPYH
jgi:hypothetical protein